MNKKPSSDSIPKYVPAGYRYKTPERFQEWDLDPMPLDDPELLALMKGFKIMVEHLDADCPQRIIEEARAEWKEIDMSLKYISRFRNFTAPAIWREIYEILVSLPDPSEDSDEEIS